MRGSHDPRYSMALSPDRSAYLSRFARRFGICQLTVVTDPGTMARNAMTAMLKSQIVETPLRARTPADGGG